MSAGRDPTTRAEAASHPGGRSDANAASSASAANAASGSIDASAANDSNDDALVRETVRLYRRYAVEVVERFTFCPYAARAREDGSAKEVVSLDAALDVARSLEPVRALALDLNVEVAFLLFPLVRVDRLELSRFVQLLRSAHQAEPGGLVLTMEGFHPDASADASSAGRVVPFLRRTPDVTIQLTRLASLDRVRRATPSGTGYIDPMRLDVNALLAAPAEIPVSERIASANLATVREHEAQIAAAIAAIHADHAATRARLGR